MKLWGKNMKMLLTKDYEVFVQRQEDPTFCAKAAAHQTCEAAVRFCKQNPTLSRSRNPAWSWSFTLILLYKILQPPLIWMEISKLLQPFFLSSGCWWAWYLQPRQLCRKPQFRWKITLGFWLISSTAHLISSTIGPCDKNQLILCSNGCSVVSNTVTLNFTWHKDVAEEAAY